MNQIWFQWSEKQQCCKQKKRLHLTANYPHLTAQYLHLSGEKCIDELRGSVITDNFVQLLEHWRVYIWLPNVYIWLLNVYTWPQKGVSLSICGIWVSFWIKSECSMAYYVREIHRIRSSLKAELWTELLKKF
jgi:hypothetical protein